MSMPKDRVLSQMLNIQPIKDIGPMKRLINILVIGWNNQILQNWKKIHVTCGGYAAGVNSHEAGVYNEWRQGFAWILNPVSRLRGGIFFLQAAYPINFSILAENSILNSHNHKHRVDSPHAHTLGFIDEIPERTVFAAIRDLTQYCCFQHRGLFRSTCFIPHPPLRFLSQNSTLLTNASIFRGRPFAICNKSQNKRCSRSFRIRRNWKWWEICRRVGSRAITRIGI